MIKILSAALSMTILIAWSLSSQANQSPIGWHWYNEPPLYQAIPKKDEKVFKQFEQLSSMQQLKLLQRATDNLKAKAVLTGNPSDIAAYKAAQDFWVQKATRFTVGWEQMLLIHPELDYSLQFSHENALASIQQRAKHHREDEAIKLLARTNGLLFFYRGKNQADQLFSSVIRRYSKRYHLTVIAVSVDGVTTSAMSSRHPVNGFEKAASLGIHYFPALVLVNPRQQRHEVVSYGFKSESEISDRLLKIADGWQSEF